MELHENQNGRPSEKAHFEREDDEVAYDGPTKRKRATPAIEEFMERVMNAKDSGVLEKRKVTYGTYLVRGEEIQLPSSVKHLKSVHGKEVHTQTFLEIQHIEFNFWCRGVSVTGGDIFLVGTAHVSRSSIEKVVEVINQHTISKLQKQQFCSLSVSTICHHTCVDMLLVTSTLSFLNTIVFGAMAFP